MLANRIMLYGSCNVYFSNYQLAASTLSNIQVQNTTKVCPELSEQVKSVIEKFKLWNYLAISQQNSTKTLSVLGQNFEILVEL